MSVIQVTRMGQGKILQANERITALLYGGLRTGKTHFAATWPRPIIIADATESGWTTIEYMDPQFWYEPDHPPRVLACATSDEVAQAIEQAKQLVQRGEALTIVFDSLTFYNDLFLSQLFNAAGAKTDKRQIYGVLGNHLLSLRIEIHKLPCNVLWLCLCKEPNAEEGQTKGGPMITGQNAVKFPASCDLILYSYRVANGEFVIRTNTYGPYIAGGRVGQLLPDPLPEPTYRCIAEHIELVDPLTRIAKVKTPAPATKPVASAPARTQPVPAARPR